MRLIKEVYPFAAGMLAIALVLYGCSGEDNSQPELPEPTVPTTPPEETDPEEPAAFNGITVLADANIYTVNTDQPRASAIAFDQNGVIIAVGDEAAVQEAAGEGARTKSLQGAFVMPGFHDLHVHALEAGLNENRCLVPAAASREQYRAAILECNDQQEGRGWVFAAGVSVTDLLEVVESPIAFLDQLVPDRPALILGSVGHSAWANSLALEEVGYLDRLDNPQGGIIDRFEDGRPTGIVFEDAQQILRTAAFPPTEANLNEAYLGLLDAVEMLVENGITTVGDAGGYWPRGHEQVWQRAEREGVLNIRASNTLYVFPDQDFDTQVAALTERMTDDPNALVQFDQVKIYTDGILSFGTGALYENYTANPGVVFGYPAGFEYFASGQLADYAVALDGAGFQLHFHATGDRGLGLALDAIERARAENPAGPAHRITHCYLINERDRARFTALNVVADFQIAPSTVGPDYRNFIRQYIGPRADSLFPVRSMLDLGATVILTSDWDADDLSPLSKLEIAITRDREAVPDLATAVRMMTIIPAEVIGRDAITGSLEPGKLADLVILDQDIFALQPSEIDETRILATVLAGNAVFDRTGLLN